MPSMRFTRLLIPTIAVAVAAAFFSTGSLSNGERASAAGPFFLNGVAEAALTSDLSPNDVHSFCRFRMTTGMMNTANLRGMCYVVTKTGPGTPAVAPPPPPPYSALLPMVNLQVLGGTISQVDASVTLTFSPSLCVPVDTQNDPDTDPDAGLTATLTTSAGKDGTMGNGNVVLNFDRGLVDGDPYDCDKVDETASTAFTPTNLAMSHDSDIWAAGMTAADGCSSWEELGTNQALGGSLRDPFNFWDFMTSTLGCHSPAMAPWLLATSAPW